MHQVAIIISSVFGALGTYLLTSRYKWSPVLSSSVLSLVVAIAFTLGGRYINLQYLNDLPLVFFGGSFVGMCSKSVVGDKNYKVLLGGMIFALVFLISGNLFKGYGGGLGFKAALSVLATIGICEIKDRFLKNFS